MKLWLKTTGRKYNHFSVIDFETTGFSSRENEIIEFAVVKVSGSAIGSCIHKLCKPAVPIGRNITRITGITNEMVEDCRSFDAQIDEFLRFIGDDVIVAHNAPFDLGFLRRYCGECGVILGNPVACTLAAARRLYPDLQNHKLATVAQHLGAGSGQYHRSLADARATAEILIRMLLAHSDAKASREAI